MADITKTMEHNLENAVLRERLEELAQNMSNKFGLTHSWTGDECKLSGGALKDGKLSIGKNTVTVELTLGFMAKMFKGRVEEEIEKWIVKLTQE